MSDEEIKAAVCRLLDDAKKHSNISSDNKLSERLKMESNGVTFWRTGRALPSEDYVVDLCNLAGREPKQGLRDHARWRAIKQKQTKAAALWAQMLPTLALPLFFVFLLATPHSAEASTLASGSAVTGDCILWKVRRWLRRPKNSQPILHAFFGAPSHA